MNVTAPNFGSTSSVETLDLNDTDLYFFEFVEYFAQRGYTRDVNIRAAPYDYRLGSSKLKFVIFTLVLLNKVSAYTQSMLTFIIVH